jgi:hypothetical protein
MNTFTGLLTLVAIVSASQAGATPCMKRLSSGKVIEPPSYAALRACHQQERDELVDLTFSTKVEKSSVNAFKQLEKRHKREQSDYLARHPKAKRSLVRSSSQPDPVEGASSGTISLKKLKLQLDIQSQGAYEGISADMAQAVQEFVIDSEESPYFDRSLLQKNKTRRDWDVAMGR